MSADLMPFAYGDNQMRVVMVDGEPEFVAADVCRMLDHSNPTSAVAGLEDDEKGLRIVETPSGAQQMVTVTEAGLYALIIRSRKPEAKAIKRWITHEVLPSIRKTGSYSTATALPGPRELAQMVIAAEDRADREAAARVEAEQRATALEAPASAWKHMASSEGDYMVRDAAKVLSRDPSIEIGQQRLFKVMQAEGWVFRENGAWKPYQTQIKTGRLAEKLHRPYLNERTGEMEVPPPSVRITPKGLAELHRRLGGTDPLATVGAAS